MTTPRTTPPPQSVVSHCATRGLAVVSDGSDFHREGGTGVLSGLLSTAALVREHSGTGATAMLITADNVAELTAELRRAAPGFSAVYLMHTNPVRGRAAQSALANTVAVITDRQTTAVALIAALLSTLDRAGTAPAAARVVIAGAQHNPLVAALAVATGIGEIDSWNLGDAHNFPLRAFARRGAVVIDLLGSAALSSQDAALDPPIPRITLDDPRAPLLALPGLLAAAHAWGPPDVATCLACARALAEPTPAGQPLPGLPQAGRSEPTHPGQTRADAAFPYPHLVR